jgi:hypothetical protein
LRWCAAAAAPGALQDFPGHPLMPQVLKDYNTRVAAILKAQYASTCLPTPPHAHSTLYPPRIAICMPHACDYLIHLARL